MICWLYFVSVMRSMNCNLKYCVSTFVLTKRAPCFGSSHVTPSSSLLGFPKHFVNPLHLIIIAFFHTSQILLHLYAPILKHMFIVVSIVLCLFVCCCVNFIIGTFFLCSLHILVCEYVYIIFQICTYTPWFVCAAHIMIN